MSRRWVRGLATLGGVALAGAAHAAAPEALPGAEPFPPGLAAKLAKATAARPAAEIRTRHRRDDGSPRFTNRLVLEASPYLLQHAHNPVDWMPWGDAAFERARKLGRPVLVSIGYSTCHWCHVMEEESFDDVATAKLLNESFVAIKVDREVRPDVDATYMAAIHAMGQSGGWPLNVWLTPEREPFFAGTYFPPEDLRGRPGFRRVLASLRDHYAERPDAVRADAKRLASAVATALSVTSASDASLALPPATLLRRAVREYRGAYDPEWGGLRGRTKFPGALPIGLLLRAHRRDADADALEMATHTLERIAASGLRDPLAGGFHRYATDSRWLVPHFEKMLYDQAREIVDYLDAWQATGRREFADVALETAAALRRDFEAPGGGFHSAWDADSATPSGELEEGRYYTWTLPELEAVLGRDDATLAALRYGVGSKHAQVEGRSVLHVARSAASIAKEIGVAEAAVAERLGEIRAKLLAARATRPKPLRDDKILSAWNGLAISALARVGFALDDAASLASASRAALALLGARDEAGRLPRLRLGEKASGVAFLDDYAFTIAGLIDLFEADGNADWLAAARALQARMDADFADAEGGGWYRTPAGAEAAIVREKPVFDRGALPAGNGVAALVGLRLEGLTGEAAYGDRARRALGAFGDALRERPTAASTLLAALDWATDTPLEVIVVLPERGGDAAPLLDVLRRVHHPNRVVAVTREGEALERLAKWVPLVDDKRARRGRPTAYVCRNRTCRYPTADPEEFERQLRETQPLEAPAKG